MNTMNISRLPNSIGFDKDCAFILHGDDRMSHGHFFQYRDKPRAIGIVPLHDNVCQTDPFVQLLRFPDICHISPHIHGACADAEDHGVLAV